MGARTERTPRERAAQLHLPQQGGLGAPPPALLVPFFCFHKEGAWRLTEAWGEAVGLGLLPRRSVKPLIAAERE